MKIFIFQPYIKLMSEQSNSIRNWSEDDRPREKLMKNGAQKLSKAELIAILIGSGNSKESAVTLSQRILKSTNNKLDELGKLTLKQLTNFKGIGPAKAITIMAAMELGHRRRSEERTEKKRITSSHDAYEIFSFLADLPHEEFWILYLNRSNSVIAKNQISQGGITGTIADVRIILKKALEMNATGVIACHNHPSGAINPSQADIKLTKKIKEAGELMEINLFDHIIVGQKQYYSFSDEGML